MKLGKNNIERSIDESRKNIRLMRGIKKFAFFPVKMHNDGDYVWLQTYYKQAEGTIRRDPVPGEPEYMAIAYTPRNVRVLRDNGLGFEESVRIFEEWVFRYISRNG